MSLKNNTVVEDSQHDLTLIALALQGDKQSLEKLIQRHQPYIYNIAWKMLLSPFDAEDVTQEILIKVITRLSQFNGKSEFRTWLYRIVVNHILNLKKNQLEEIIHSFEDYFAGLDQMPDKQLNPAEALELKESIEDARISCTAGMLLCLDRDQRMILVLGDIFGIDHKTGAEIFEITRANFRQKLSRARKDLYNWMNNRCGLVNKSNPCQCPKKAKAFIEQGYVDPVSLRFNSNYDKKVRETMMRDVNVECNTIEDLHQQIFLDHPFKQPQKKDILEIILQNDEIRRLYNF